MTRPIALLFPGQGSQYVGMGKNIETNIFSKANETLGYNLTGLMFEGPEETLKLTENTQPAIVAHSLALYEQVRPLLAGRNITAVMGHSVGEYAALAAAGVFSYDDAIKAVHLRGKYMQAATPVGTGKMFAIMKVPEDVIIKACKEVSQNGSEVMPANFNEPSQIVISGEAKACERAVKWLEENFKEAHRAIELNVSAPFHSSLMIPAAQKLKAELDKMALQTSKLPYIANIDAELYGIGTDGETIKNNLIKQAAGSVLWTQSFMKLPENTLCLEVGPGRVLMGLARKIRRDVDVIAMDKEESLAELEKALNS